GCCRCPPYPPPLAQGNRICVNKTAIPVLWTPSVLATILFCSPKSHSPTGSRGRVGRGPRRNALAPMFRADSTHIQIPFASIAAALGRVGPIILNFSPLPGEMCTEISGGGQGRGTGGSSSRGRPPGQAPATMFL